MRRTDPAYPQPSSPAVSATMRGNRKVDTRPELLVRRRLHARGLRFRKNHLVKVDGVSVRADIVFPRLRVAIFIDGCFWHSCPAHSNVPRSNQEYWTLKLEKNRRRDRNVSGALEQAGWHVVRIWEHVPADAAVEEIVTALEY